MENDVKATRVFTLEYEHKGHKWAMTLFAEDWDDAIAKVGSIQKSLVIVGSMEEMAV